MSGFSFSKIKKLFFRLTDFLGIKKNSQDGYDNTELLDEELPRTRSMFKEVKTETGKWVTSIGKFVNPCRQKNWNNFSNETCDESPTSHLDFTVEKKNNNRLSCDSGVYIDEIFSNIDDDEEALECLIIDPGNDDLLPPPLPEKKRHSFCPATEIIIENCHELEDYTQMIKNKFDEFHGSNVLYRHKREKLFDKDILDDYDIACILGQTDYLHFLDRKKRADEARKIMFEIIC